jgi:hypothetical protein
MQNSADYPSAEHNFSQRENEEKINVKNRALAKIQSRGDKKI